MEPWLVVWLLVIVLTTLALGVLLVSLVRQVILLGRTAGRMQETLQPILDELASASAGTADAAARLSRSPRRGGPRSEARG